MTRWTTLFAATIVANAVAAGAHHSLAAVYDSRRQATIEGTVAQFRLINPHPFLFVDVTDGDGGVQRWQLELDNRHELVAIGVTADTFRPGDRVVVSGSLARTQPNSLYVLRLDRPADGFRYEQVGSSPRIRSGIRDSGFGIRRDSLGIVGIRDE